VQWIQTYSYECWDERADKQTLEKFCPSVQPTLKVGQATCARTKTALLVYS
jgi:hypothetical protein